MTKVVVSGYYGFANAGDEAMLTAMIEALTDIEPQIQITVISGNPEDTKARHGVDAVYRLNYPAIVCRLAAADLLLRGGGSLLQDVTSGRSLYYYLSIMLLAKKMGKPVMLYAQGIGPVRGRLAKAAMRWIGNMADLITVRDEGSSAELRRLRVFSPPVHVTADAVLATHPIDRQIGRHILQKNGVEGGTPLIGVSAREWRDWTHYKQVMAAALDQMAGEFGARVVFLPMQWPDGMEASRKIVAMMKTSATLLAEHYSNGELLSLVGNMDVLIGIRLHALIFAAVMGTPMAGISYDPKIDRFLESVGALQVGDLQSVTATGLLTAVKTLRAKQGQKDSAREDRIHLLREKACKNAELALSLIGTKAGSGK